MIFLKWHECTLKFDLNAPFTTYKAWSTQSLKIGKLILKALFRTSNIKANIIALLAPYITTSFIYSSLLKTIFVRPTAETKILRQGFTENTIQKVYLRPFTVTNEVKIIMLQSKVIPNVLPTCATLYRDGISIYATPKNKRCITC